MKLKEYIENLKSLMEKYPEAKDWDVVFSQDDEGNSFHPVYYTPVVGKFWEGDYEFRAYNENEEDMIEKISKDEINAVCIN